MGQRLKQLREEKGYSLRELEAHSHIDNSDLSKIERGQQKLTFITLCKIAQGLEIPFTTLLDGFDL
ncbi:helix-turn-helix domain-containing protein [Chitinophaga pendula]|uniref:helix-turn-helix domain-containing protein n=1 Tax=Chitinophaga TaxID=79328 RepID=UPI0012FD7A74|nr:MULTISPECIES: helix-turn-helix transcriptional regulator [Chitinophaga]UCJ09988.1 helix-turn-helix domain-containing protein [Chitinophaga pendula]